MIDLPRKQKPTNGFRKAWNRLIDWLRSNTLYSSNDITVYRTPTGTSLKINPSLKGGNLRYESGKAYAPNTVDVTNPQTDYESHFDSYIAKWGSDHSWHDPSASYQVGQIVRVKERVLAGYDPITASSAIYSEPAAYICVSPVPGLLSAGAQTAMETFIANQPASEQFKLRKNIRSGSVIYSPIYPEPCILDSYYSASYASPTDYRQAQGRFWERIGILSGSNAESSATYYGRIQKLYHDYMMIVPVSSSISDGPSYLTGSVFVAKHLPQRMSVVSESIDSTTFTYIYTDSNNRIANDGVTTQSEVCYPRYATNGLIVFTKVAGSIMNANYSASLTASGSASAIVYTETSPGRVWIRKYP